MAGFSIADLLNVGEEITPKHLEDVRAAQAELERFPSLPGETAVRIVRAPSTRAYGRTVMVPGADPVPFRILPMEPTRVKATLKVPPAAVFTGTVRIGQSSDLSGGDGFTMYPGDSRDVETVDDIYIQASATVAISVWIELNPEA